MTKCIAPTLLIQYGNGERPARGVGMSVNSGFFSSWRLPDQSLLSNLYIFWKVKFVTHSRVDAGWVSHKIMNWRILGWKICLTAVLNVNVVSSVKCSQNLFFSAQQIETIHIFNALCYTILTIISHAMHVSCSTNAMGHREKDRRSNVITTLHVYLQQLWRNFCRVSYNIWNVSKFIIIDKDWSVVYFDYNLL